MEETYGFVDVEPAKRTVSRGGGRRREPNPFVDGVRLVCGKTDENGAPVYKGAPFNLNTERGETLAQRKSRTRRFLTRAGKDLAELDGAAEPYSIGMSIEQLDDGGEFEYIVKFWDRRAGK